MEEKKVREKDFDIDGFLNVLEPYYKGGEYDYLLNSDKELDLLHKRFIVFEIDAIKGASACRRPRSTAASLSPPTRASFILICGSGTPPPAG